MDEHKVEHKPIFLHHRYLHPLAKLAVAEGIELRSQAPESDSLLPSYPQVDLTHLLFNKLKF